jgi:hypothetical protein
LGILLQRCEIDGAYINDRKAVMKARFQFTLKRMMLVVALLAGSRLFLRPSTVSGPPMIAVSGPALFQPDGSVEVQRGAVWISGDDKQTEIRAERIVVPKDGTARVYGPGTLRQTVP